MQEHGDKAHIHGKAHGIVCNGSLNVAQSGNSCHYEYLGKDSRGKKENQGTAVFPAYSHKLVVNVDCCGYYGKAHENKKQKMKKIV